MSNNWSANKRQGLRLAVKARIGPAGMAARDAISLLKVTRAGQGAVEAS